jgi:hypothetical protein
MVDERENAAPHQRVHKRRRIKRINILLIRATAPWHRQISFMQPEPFLEMLFLFYQLQ